MAAPLVAAPSTRAPDHLAQVAAQHVRYRMRNERDEAIARAEMAEEELLKALNHKTASPNSEQTADAPVGQSGAAVPGSADAPSGVAAPRPKFV